MPNEVRVRFAPSPTGFLHVGGARTALFNWLWARKNDGKFILRIEDTDLERSTEESTAQILDSLKWLGLEWDEGPYYQRERIAVYLEQLERLRKDACIYPAFESKEELEEMRERAQKEGRTRVYDRRSLDIEPEEVARRMETGDPYVWRFRVPDEGYTEVPETLLGGADTRFKNAEIDDFIITRPGTMETPGIPLYNFACAIDDALMGITHVIRGADHLANTAKQVLLMKALGFEPPVYTHLPLIMKDKKKMSKRDEEADPRFPVSVSARRELGYLKQATVNFLALLGWSFPGDKELFTVQELIAAFDLDRLQKANANFDEDKYLFQNGWYIRNLPLEGLTEKVIPFLEKAGLPLAMEDPARLSVLIDMVRERCKLLSDFPGALSYFDKAPDSYEAKGVKKIFQKEGVAETLMGAAAVLDGAAPFTKDGLEGPLRQYAEEKGLGFGKIAQPIRLAVCGRTASPGLFDVLEQLGKEESVARIQKAAALIAEGNIPEH